MVWNFASVLSRIGLGAALVGVALVTYGFIDYSKKSDEKSDGPTPRAIGLGKLAKAGFILFVGGVALSCFVFALRIMHPWGE
jgi:hypothetical protein